MAVIIISAVFFNYKIEDKATELIKLLENDVKAEEINTWWDENKIWFEVFVPEELKKGVETNIILYKKADEDKLVKAQIKTSAEKVLDSTKISISNIF